MSSHEFAFVRVENFAMFVSNLHECQGFTNQLYKQETRGERRETGVENRKSRSFWWVQFEAELNIRTYYWYIGFLVWINTNDSAVRLVRMMQIGFAVWTHHKVCPAFFLSASPFLFITYLLILDAFDIYPSFLSFHLVFVYPLLSCICHTCYKPGFHPNVTQILTEFPENWQKKKRINACFHPLSFMKIVNIRSWFMEINRLNHCKRRGHNDMTSLKERQSKLKPWKAWWKYDISVCFMY